MRAWFQKLAARLGPATRPVIKPSSLTIPLGVAFWAHVSEEVDKKLEAQQQVRLPFRLAPHEWKSGEIPWLLAVLAPKEVAQA